MERTLIVHYFVHNGFQYEVEYVIAGKIGDRVNLHFGRDADGDLYILTKADGILYKMTEANMTDDGNKKK